MDTRNEGGRGAKGYSQYRVGVLRLLEERASHATEHAEVLWTPHININGANVAFPAK